MAEHTHAGSGLSYLKYNLFIFMRVFAEFLIVCIASLALVVLLQPSSAVRESLALLVADLDWPPYVQISWPFGTTMLSFALSVFVAWFVYVLMELGSFIFNVHHVVMTNVSWELLQEKVEEAADSPSPEDKPGQPGNE
jgi:ABC-type multidrug transport system fused ATPase/permease subunit